MFLSLPLRIAASTAYILNNQRNGEKPAKMIITIKKNVAIIRQMGVKGWIYGYWEYARNSEIPLSIAKILKSKWKNDQVKVLSYDGSNQCVHPDVIQYKGDLYLASTPYPYAIDVYENPQLSKLNKEVWELCDNMPFVKPNKPGILHYSDPFMYTDSSDSLYYFYRLTDRSNDSKSIIYYVNIDDDSKKEVRFTAKYDFEYISPFVIKCDSLYFFHIETDANNHLYVRRFHSFDDIIDESVSISEVKLVGFEKNEDIWHLGVSSARDYNSKVDDNGEFNGVVTYIKDANYSHCYNCFCKLLYDGNSWTLYKMQPLDQGKIDCKYPYKSCLCEIDNKKYIYETVIDNKYRHGLFALKVGEKEFGG